MSENNNTLLLDAGNSVLKWAICTADDLQFHGHYQYPDKQSDGGIGKAIRNIPQRFSRACVSSVAGDKVNQAIRQTLQTCFGISPVFQQVTPDFDDLQVAYAQPETLGVDRWLAMIGAKSMHTGAVCVADCGTALTVDAVNADGRHLGGVIVPGHRLMQQTLFRQTAQIYQADKTLPESIHGNTTGAAVNAGSSYALAALVDRFVDETDAAQASYSVLIVTGGDRERILRLARHDAVEVPDLVLLGLAQCVRRQTAIG